jgi:hypothetical protein
MDGDSRRNGRVADDGREDTRWGQWLKQKEEEQQNE